MVYKLERDSRLVILQTDECRQTSPADITLDALSDDQFDQAKTLLEHMAYASTGCKRSGSALPVCFCVRIGPNGCEDGALVSVFSDSMPSALPKPVMDLLNLLEGVTGKPLARSLQQAKPAVSAQSPAP